MIMIKKILYEVGGWLMIILIAIVILAISIALGLFYAQNIFKPIADLFN
jgi:hypothetical protein